MNFVNVTALSDTSASVVWKPTDVNVDSYVVVVDGDNVSLNVTVAGSQTSAIVNGLMERTNYNVTVFAVRNGVRSTTSPTFMFSTLPDGKYCTMYVVLIFV